MSSNRHRFLVWIVAPLVASCGGAGSAPAPATTPPAKVDGRVAEASLTTLTLTTDAVARLGIESAVVEEREVTRTRRIGGEVIAAGGADVTISAPFAGTLEAAGTSAVAGARVTHAAPLFRLVPLTVGDRDLRGEAERSVQEASARQQLAVKQAERTARLAQDGSGSQRAAEEAQSALAIANANLASAQERRTLATSGAGAGGTLLVVAPFAGVLGAVHAAPGQTVAAGTPLVSIVRLDTVWVRVPVFAGDLVTINRRASARISAINAGAADEGVSARPVSAPPTSDSTAATVDLYFALDNSGGAWQPGQRVSVRLSLVTMPKSLVVPYAALLHDAYGGTWVYEVQAPGTYVRRRVLVRDITGGFVVLDRGPAPGSRVVTSGAAELFGTEFGVGK